MTASSLPSPALSPSAPSLPRLYLVTFLLAVVGFACLYPLDSTLQPLLHQRRLGGDVRRLLETLQQFGDIATLLLTGVIVWQMDPPRRAKLADLALAALVVALACNVMKMGLGRPRPVLADVWAWVLPWQQYPLPAATPDVAPSPVYAWEFWARRSNLWSMPSSHTAAAVTLGLFLSRQYRPLTGLCVAIVLLVAAARVILGAHYPSDVWVGGCLSYALSTHILSRQYASRRFSCKPQPRFPADGAG